MHQENAQILINKTLYVLVGHKASRPYIIYTIMLCT